LTLRILPKPVRESLALAYLLARLSDTVADEAKTTAEEELIARRAEIENCLAASPDRRDIEAVWTTIREGQRFDQQRFSTSGTSPLSDQELDRYAYLVAGCVGEFWTELCARKMPGFCRLSIAEMKRLGVRFGKGLQLVNILRDREADSSKGRTYVPTERFGTVLAEARAHLQAARRYVDALRNYRLRVACLLPLYLAEETLDLLEENPSAPRAKVSRRRVWTLFLRALCLGKADFALDRTIRVRNR
jgi:farnesyl-diphosphate farnesyltransferase